MEAGNPFESTDATASGKKMSKSEMKRMAALKEMETAATKNTSPDGREWVECSTSGPSIPPPPVEWIPHPPEASETGVACTYLQLHDAFLPLGLGSGQLTISTVGAKAVESITKVPGGFNVVHKVGRRFFIPAGNVSFAEYE